METYARAAVERAMKVPEIIMRALAKKANWAQAGEIIGLCERQMRHCWRATLAGCRVTVYQHSEMMGNGWVSGETD